MYTCITPYVKRVIYKYIDDHVLLTILYNKPDPLKEQVRQVKILKENLHSVTAIEFTIYVLTDLLKIDCVNLANLIYEDIKR